jgi:hypothetical protein
MYVALFLTPWILLYALSSLVFNHMGAISKWYGGNLNQFEKVEEIEYQDAFAPGTTPAEAAKLILLDLNLDGAHFTQGSPTGERFTIMRQSPFALKRVSYLPKAGKVIVEKQIASLPSMLIRLHMRHGYEQKYGAMKFWALAVELTVFAMLFWIVSGLWLWWELKPARTWGAAFAGFGLGLFAVLLFAI